MPIPEWHYKSKVRPATRPPARVSGTWTATFHCERGDFPANPVAPFVFGLFIDGEQVDFRLTALADRDYDGRGGQRVVVEVDTTRFPDGPRLVTAWGYPSEPEPGAPERWNARWEALVTFANGAVAMAPLPSAQPCVVHDDAPVTITADCLHCDGTTHPAGFLTLSTAHPDRVAIAGTTLRVLTPGWATVTVHDEATGRSADIRVGRYDADARALPHLGRDWTVKRAVDAQSRFVVAPFYQSIRDAMRDPALAAALRDAGLLTFWDHVGPNVGRATLAQYKAEWERRTEGYWDFLERNGGDVHLVFDAIGRTRAEARASLDNPIAAEAYAWALAQWRTRARGYGIRVIDEVAGLWTGDPRPHDRRWDHFAGPLAVAASRDPFAVRIPGHDFSSLPVQPPPANGDASSDMRPRLYVTTGAHAGTWCRIVRGDRSGTLTLAADTPSLVGGFDPRTMRLAAGDRVVVAGWYADPGVALPDDTIVRLVAMLRAGGIPFGFPAGALAPGRALGAWSRVGDIADVYSHLAPGDDCPPSPEGSTLPQGRHGRDLSWQAAQDAIDSRLPFMALVPAAGPHYTKRTNRRSADYDPKVDILHGGTGRARYTAMHLALALVDGACGASVYFFDTTDVRDQRARETYPRTVLPEPAQTGFHPFAKGVGGEIFRAVAAFRKLVDVLGARVFAPLGVARALGPGLRVSRRGDLLLVVNTRERPATTVPLALRAAATRWRLVGERLTSEPLAPGGTRLVLEPGELTAIVGAAQDA